MKMRTMRIVKKIIVIPVLALGFTLGLTNVGFSEEKKVESRTESTEKAEPMIKVSYIMRRLPEMSREEFLNYWEKNHSQKVDQNAIAALGVKRYIQQHALQDDEARKILVGPRSVLVDEFDGIAEVWFENLEVFKRNWTTKEAIEIYKQLFVDELNFIDWSRSTIMISKEVVFMP